MYYLILLLGLSPLLRVSPEGGLLSRDTVALSIFSAIALLVFFLLHHYSVHKIIRLALPVFFTAIFSSVVVGTFSPSIYAFCIWIFAIFFGIAVWSLRTSTTSRSIITAVCIGCIGIYAQWGIAQFVVQHDLGMHVLGESRIAPGIPGVASFSSNNIKYVRAYGPFAHANSFAGVILIGTILLYSLQSSSRSYNLSIFSIYWLALIASFSRTAIMGGCIVLILLYIRANKLRFFIPLCILFLLFAPLVLQRSFDPHSVALEDRATGVSWMWNMRTPASALRGYGIGNYERALTSYLKLNHIPHDPWDIAPVHSSPLLLFSELGVVLSLIIAFFAVSFFRSYRSTALIALIPCLLFDHYFITQVGPMLYLITCAVLVVQYKGGHRNH